MRVNVDLKVLSDIRFVLLGNLLKRTRAEAFGLCIILWLHCQETRVDVLTDSLIDTIVGKKNFTRHALDAQLLEHVSENRFRIKGVRERIEEMEEKSKKQSEKGKLGAEKRWHENSHGHKSEIATAIIRPLKKMAPYSNSNSNSNSEEERTKKEDLDLPQTKNQPPPPSPYEFPANEWEQRPDQPVQLLEAELDELRRGEGCNHSLNQSGKLKAKKTHSKERTATLEGPYQLWEFYQDRFKARYGTIPALTKGKALGLCKNILGSLSSFDEARQVIDHYLHRKDVWFITKAHSLDVLLSNIQKLKVEVSSGNIITQNDARKAALAENNKASSDKASKHIAIGGKTIMEELDEYLEHGSSENRLRQAGDRGPSLHDGKTTGPTNASLLREGIEPPRPT